MSRYWTPTSHTHACTHPQQSNDFNGRLGPLQPWSIHILLGDPGWCMNMSRTLIQYEPLVYAGCLHQPTSVKEKLYRNRSHKTSMQTGKHRRSTYVQLQTHRLHSQASALKSYFSFSTTPLGEVISPEVKVRLKGSLKQKLKELQHTHWSITTCRVMCPKAMDYLNSCIKKCKSKWWKRGALIGSSGVQANTVVFMC